MVSLCMPLIFSGATAEPPAPPAAAPLFPALFSVGLAVRGTGLVNLPRTLLDVDPDTGHWRVGDLFQEDVNMQQRLQDVEAYELLCRLPATAFQRPAVASARRDWA